MVDKLMHKVMKRHLLDGAVCKVVDHGNNKFIMDTKTLVSVSTGMKAQIHMAV